MTLHRFRSELWEHTPGDPASWHFLTVPPEVSEDLTFEVGPREGFGSIRVEVQIGGTTWRTSLFPDAAAGTFVLPVKKSVRRTESLQHGSICAISLEAVTTDPDHLDAAQG